MMRPHRRQRGLALVCALLLMLAAMLLSVSVARTAFGSVASARQERDRIVAHAAAEAALRDAEKDLAGGAQPASARAGYFAVPAGGAPGAASTGFVAGCGRGADDLGLCLPAVSPLPPVWQSVDLAQPDNPVLVPYGRYTGATLASGSGILPARPPAYLIEKLDPGPAAAGAGAFYRITAIGFGTNATTRVVLQLVYRKPAAGAPPSGAGGTPAGGNDDDGPVPGASEVADAPPQPQSPQLPAGRIGWRAIANWPELHAQAQQ